VEKLDKKVGFIGAGNMAEAFIGALTGSGLCDSGQILVSDVDPKRLERVRSVYGIETTPDNRRVFAFSQVLVLAVKPQKMQEVLLELRQGGPAGRSGGRRVVISIAAGVRIERIETILYAPLDEEARSRLPIVRVMPNTPALVLAGMSGMAPNRFATEEDIAVTRRILGAIGKVELFQEEALDAVTAVSGSGPAYVFYLAEAMMEGGEAAGLSSEASRLLTVETLKGAALLLEKQAEPPAVLRSRVTSPGGTTEAALKILEGHAVGKRIVEAVVAAALRSRELSAT